MKKGPTTFRDTRLGIATWIMRRARLRTAPACRRDRGSRAVPPWPQCASVRPLGTSDHHLDILSERPRRLCASQTRGLVQYCVQALGGTHAIRSALVAWLANGGRGKKKGGSPAVARAVGPRWEHAWIARGAVAAAKAGATRRDATPSVPPGRTAGRIPEATQIWPDPERSLLSRSPTTGQPHPAVGSSPMGRAHAPRCGWLGGGGLAHGGQRAARGTSLSPATTAASGFFRLCSWGAPLRTRRTRPSRRLGYPSSTLGVTFPASVRRSPYAAGLHAARPGLCRTVRTCSIVGPRHGCPLRRPLSSAPRLRE